MPIDSSICNSCEQTIHEISRLPESGSVSHSPAEAPPPSTITVMSTSVATSRGFSLNRSSMVSAVRSKAASGEPFDLVVIGGGITGAGVALDAATRGMSVLLVDRGDLASGTSSKSSKLIHGGLRYLQQGDVGLVREALKERRILMRNAPHLVSVLPFLLPIFTKNGLFPRRIARALGSALWAYDTAGGWRIGRLHRRLRRSRVVELCPGLPEDRIAGGYLYYDASADDARLTLDVARTAAAYGALVVNHCPVTTIDVTNGQVSGVTIELEGSHIGVHSRCVVNAGGVWASKVDALISQPLTTSLQPVDIRPARGVHVSIPWELVRNRVAVVLPVPGDRRSVFLIPSGPNDDGTFDLAHIGTTDTEHASGLDDPRCTADDIDYLLRAVNHSFGSNITSDHVLGIWSGLRPLVVPTGNDSAERTADLSRRHRVDASPSGVVRVIGGKLTTYRQMAEGTVDQVESILGRRTRCQTSRTPIIGRSNAVLAQITSEDPSLGNEIVPGSALTGAEVVDSVRNESALTLIDVVTRRSRLHIEQRDRALSTAERVAALMADELDWDEEQRQAEIASYLALCEAEVMAQQERP